jgi:membrane protein DedA with SNARE-associated domain
MKKNKKPSKKPKPLNNYVKFSGMAIQMGVTISLGAWGGSTLDEKLNTDSRIFTIILSLLAIGIAMYLVIREVINMQKEDEE